ncbi:MAG TPA: translocation/assembly module TamB domain-containing protein [Rhodopila sp.]|nr:translocation/assembly module TamB domain-containing protein [Rhodopila sp.]
MIRRVFKWMLGILLVLLAIPVLAVLAVLILANTGFGRHLIETETASLTGGMVRIENLGGRFPDRLRAGKIIVSDAKGPYVTVSDLELDWSPLQLLHKTAQVQVLQAQGLQVSRLPESSGKKSTSKSSFSLPVHVDLKRLQIDHATIAKPVVGVAAALKLTGSAQIQSLQEGTVRLAADRLDSPGQYDVNATLTPQALKAAVTANEPAKGLISSVAHLPELGAIAVKADVNGPKDKLATQVAINAGPLTASAAGTVDMVHEGADLTVKAQAPQMTPAPGLSWQSVLVDANVRGSATKPIANGIVRIDGLAAAGARIGVLVAKAHGNADQANLDASIQDLHVPGPQPDLFAAAPITLTAQALLNAPNRPVTFSVQHPLLAVDGTAEIQGAPSVKAHLVLPDLGPLAGAAGTDLQGKADLNLGAQSSDGTTAATLSGILSVTGGKAPVPALIGQDCRIDLAGSMRGKDVTVSKLAVNGKALTVGAHGSLSDQNLDAAWHVTLADVAAVEPTVSGSVDVTGQTTGKLDDLNLQADIGADLATKDYKPGHVDAHVVATDLPKAPHAVINASGTLLDSPLSLALTAAKSDAGIAADINQLSWKSLSAHGAMNLPPNQTIPVGNLALQIGRLADFAPLVGQPIQGQAEATLDSDQQAAKLALTLRGVSVPGTATVGKAVLNATVADPSANPTVDGTLTADGVSASSVRSASARVTAKGPLDALALTVSANAADVAGGPAKVALAGTADAKNRVLALSRLETSWKDQTVRLLAPAKIAVANGVSVDRLRLGFRQAELIVAGTAGSTLDLTATLRNLPADVAAIASPSLAASGIISADARLTGTSTRPEGTIKLAAHDVHLRKGPGAALPPANLNVDVVLAGTNARLDSRLVAGPSHVTVTGTVPIAAGGAMNVKTDARMDLTMLDPLLMAQGERARGIVALNAVATGTIKAPQVRGTATLRDGSVTDYPLGAHLSNLNALIEASGNTIRLTRFQGKAGRGTLGGSGSVTLTGDMPVSLHVTANDARPLSSDLMTAVMNADLMVQGALKGDLRAGGRMFIKEANINIPDKLPSSVAVLPVRNPNAPPPPPPQPSETSNVALDLTIDAPQQVFIRGRGLFAEVGGKIHVGGTAAAPVPSGGLHLRRGQFTVIGTTLNFTEGTVSFAGAGISDPSIHFVAQSQTTTMTAILTVSGTAKHPEITLSSNPEMPQDEILAQLLFNTTTSKLSPLQLAEIASALAQLSGASSGIGDPLEAVRNALGLDRLAIGSDSAGNPTLEAGRYVARGVYVGAKQGAGGGGTQATVQVDLYKGLKLDTTAGTLANNATGSTAGTEGASVGLTYQFQY